MGGRTDAGIGDGDLVLVGLHILDETLEIGRLEVLAGDDGHRHIGDETDIVEGVERIIGELAIEGGTGGHADVMQQDGVAIRLGARHAASAQRAAGAADVFDKNLLAEILGHGFSDETCDRVGRTTRGERHDHGDRALGIGLSRCGCGDEGCAMAVALKSDLKKVMKASRFDGSCRFGSSRPALDGPIFFR